MTNVKKHRREKTPSPGVEQKVRVWSGGRRSEQLDAIKSDVSKLEGVYSCELWYPIPSMYGLYIYIHIYIYTYIYHKNQPNVGKYTTHVSYGVCNWWYWNMPLFGLKPLNEQKTCEFRDHKSDLSPNEKMIFSKDVPHHLQKETIGFIYLDVPGR